MSKKMRTGLKKSVSMITAVATIVWLSGLAILLVPAVTIVADERPSVVVEGITVYDGDLISSNATNSDGTPTYASLDIYIAKVVSATETYKRLVLNPQVFDSYGHLNWGDVQEVSQTVMDAFTTSCLTREDGDTKVYAMAPDDDTGTKSWVNLTETEFIGATTGTYSSNDADAIYTINSTDAGNYTATGDLTTVTAFETYLGDGTLPATATTGTGLTVSLASDTPAAVLIPKATNVPFTKINLTAASDGDMSVSTLVLSRTGIGQANDISGVTLYLDGIQKGDAKTFNSTTNKVTYNFYSNPIVVPAGTTVSLEVKVAIDTSGNVGGSEQHQIGIVSASDVTTTSGTVSGSFPVYGNIMSLSNTAVAALTATATYTSNVNKNIGLTQERFAEFTLAEGSTEDVKINSIRFVQGGSIAASEISNLKLYQGATEIPTTVNIDDVNKYVTFTVTDPYLLAKGNSKQFTVKGDIVSGYDRTIKLYFSSDSDIDATGQTYGYGSTLTYTAFDSADANCALITVTGGALNIALASDTPGASNVIAGQGDVEFGRWTITTVGSAVEIKNMEFDLTTVGTKIADEISDLKLWDQTTKTDTSKGIVVSGPITSGVTSGAGTINVDLADDFTIGADSTVTYLLTGDISSSATATSYQFKLDTAVATGTLYAYSPVSRAILATTDVVPQGVINAAVMTVVDTALVVTKSATPADQTVVAGKTGVEFIGYSFQSSAATDITISQVKFTGSASTLDAHDQILSVELWDDTEKISGPYNLDSSDEVTFSGLSYVIPASSSKKLIAKANLASTAVTYNYALGIAAAADIVSYDSSGNSVTATDGDSTWSQTNAHGDIAVTSAEAGTLAMAKATSQELSAILLTGSTDQVATKIKFSATNEIIDVNEITVVNSGDNDADVSKVYIYDGSTVVASGDLSNHKVSFTGLSIEVPKNSSKTLTIKADITSATAGANSGDEIQLEVAGLVKATGRDSGSTVYATSDVIKDGGTAEAFAASSKISRWAPTTTATVTTANELPFVVALGDIIYYYGDDAGAYTWGIVTTYSSVTSFVITDDAGNGDNTVTAGYQFSRITPSSTQLIAADDTLTSAVTVGDIVFYRKKSGNYNWGVVVSYSAVGTFTIGMDSSTAAKNIDDASRLSVVTPSTTDPVATADNLPFALTVGDIVFFNDGTNYTWGIATAYASATSFTITDDSGNDKTTIPTSQISVITPSATSTDDASNDSKVAFAAGDLMMAKGASNYGWGVATTGSVNSSVHKLYNTKIGVVASSTQPNTTLVEGSGIDLIRVTVSNESNAANADAKITQIDFTINASNVTADNFKIYDTSDMSTTLATDDNMDSSNIVSFASMTTLIIEPGQEKELLVRCDAHYQDSDNTAGGVAGSLSATLASFGSSTNKGVVTPGKVTWNDGITTSPAPSTGITWTDSSIDSVAGVARSFTGQADTYAVYLVSAELGTDTVTAGDLEAVGDSILLTFSEPIDLATSTIASVTAAGWVALEGAFELTGPSDGTRVLNANTENFGDGDGGVTDGTDTPTLAVSGKVLTVTITGTALNTAGYTIEVDDTIDKDSEFAANDIQDYAGNDLTSTAGVSFIGAAVTIIQ